MIDFRYIRMAENNQGWMRPHGGRRGGTGYVGMQGFGHEDWNFARDVWKDGRYHLYLKPTPRDFDKGQFNFVLGAHAKPVPMVVAFVENATYGLSELPQQVLLKRAQEIFALNEDDSLGPLYRDLNVDQIAARLMHEANAQRISVAPQDLHVLAQPVPMPLDVYKVSFPGYRALPMKAEQYSELKQRILSEDTATSVHQENSQSFPEGSLVEKLHYSRERNRKAVELARKQFIAKNGHLFCEACGLVPEKHFSSIKMRNRIIEVHHDIPLSDPTHTGITLVSDLRMVCPTCHRAIHTIRPWLTVKKFRKFLGLEK